MPQEIIAFENEKIFCCKNTECNQDFDNCVNPETGKCCKKYYNELEALCSKSENFFFNCLEKKDNYIKCLKYAGYFQLNDSRGVWILPKIKMNGEDKIVDTGRQIFENLLETSRTITNVKTGNNTLTELSKERVFIAILIRLFCFYMDNLFKKGLKKHYSLSEDNLPYLKGKIKFSEHIKRNIVSKEKFYVEFDEFTEDIPENRILVSTCNYLIKKISSLKKEQSKQLQDCQKKLKRYIQEFGDIEESKNLIKDFAKIQPNRLYNHYDKPLLFAEVFLSHKNYWINKGRKKFPAIMFSLHELFEDYIENLIWTILPKMKGVEFKTQFKGKDNIINYLFEQNLFATRMDFVLYKEEHEQEQNGKKGKKKKEKNNKKSKYIVLDAKYKIINLKNDIEEAKNNKEEKDIEKIYQQSSTHISQIDLYQVFAYSEIIKKKYKVEDSDVEIVLLYPRNKDFEKQDPYTYFNGTNITFIPIDLTGENEDEKIRKNNELIDFLTNYFNKNESKKNPMSKNDTEE